MDYNTKISKNSKARKRNIYDTRSSSSSYSKKSSYFKDSTNTYNNNSYNNYGGAGNGYGNRKWYSSTGSFPSQKPSFTFRTLFESSPFSKFFGEKKRRIYDQYGKDGLNGDGGRRPYGRSHRQYQSSQFDDFDIMGGFPFVFRPPEEVFREFFGVNSPFSEIFADMNGSSRRRNHGHNIHNPHSLMTNFMSPMIGLSMMDNFFPEMPSNNGFSTFSSFNFSSNGGNSAIKRTSTSTTFTNGKKIMTKKMYENGKETVYSYENDVLKSKTVNGVPQTLSSITN
ncbi:DNAJB6 family protein [Megaselia abdita]